MPKCPDSRYLLSFLVQTTDHLYSGILSTLNFCFFCGGSSASISSAVSDSGLAGRFWGRFPFSDFSGLPGQLHTTCFSQHSSQLLIRAGPVRLHGCRKFSISVPNFRDSGNSTYQAMLGAPQACLSGGPLCGLHFFRPFSGLAFFSLNRRPRRFRLLLQGHRLRSSLPHSLNRRPRGRDFRPPGPCPLPHFRFPLLPLL